MTDITELAQIMKAAAEKATPGPWEVQFGEEIYATDGVDNEQVAIATLDARDADYIALANPANVLALIEALEKAQTINAAAEKLVRCKGRYHSEQNCRALAALFGVNTPDLPPLDDESHAVTVENLQESAYRAGLTAGWNLGLANNNDGFNKCLAAHTAGIKVEAE